MTLAACGGDANDGVPDETKQARPGTLRALWNAQGENVALVPGTSDYAPGEVRVSFLVVDSQSRAIFSSEGARIWLAKGLDDKPFLRGRATLETLRGRSEEVSLYVARLRVPEPGKYTLLAEPIGTKPIQGVGNVVVEDESKTPAVGDKAIPSRTPTLAEAPAERISTANPPHTELLRHSVAQSLAAREPFVLAFATPKFCESRTCGPVVDVVDEVRQRIGPRVRFIHVEIYEDNDPALGTNRWVVEWRLPTEPWVFLVGADGRIKAKFEGAVSARELEGAIRSHLLGK